MAEKTRTKRSLWNIFENFEGDNVVWMIVLLLMLISVVCMFSSTSSLVGRGIEQSRINVVKDQIFLVAAGLLVIIAVYNIRNLAVIRWLSKLGFIVSFLLLLILVAKLNIGSFIKSGGFNDANRIIKVGGIQVHVFEIVKVSMIMYFAWAMDALKRGKLGGPEKPAWKKILYIYAPFAIIFVMVLSGGNSSAIIIGGMMFIIIAIGGGDFKDLAILIGAGVLILGLSYGAYKLSDGKIMGRIGTGVSRLFEKTDWEEIANTSRPGSAEWYDAIDEIRQPYSAKIAIREGGFFGKGPGQSTQRYVVSNMPEDFMYSFIIEEYGILGGMVVLMLYISLLARGSLIVRHCGKELFPKLAAAGLIMLIVLQAFLHMFVNCDIGPMTGQTLPLISNGASAFLCFCMAFGIILSVSRYASKKMKKEQMQAAPLVEREEIKHELDALDDFESGKVIDDEIIDQDYDL